MQKLSLFLFAIVFSFAATAQTNWKVYNHTETKCTIKYPANWELTDTIESTPFFIFSPLENDADDFRENINLSTVSTAGEDVTLKQLVTENEDALQEGITNFKKLKNRYFTWNGKPAYEIVYEGEIESVAFKLKWTQRYLLYKDMAYVLTYTGRADKPDKQQTTGIKIMDTFKVK